MYLLDRLMSMIRGKKIIVHFVVNFIKFCHQFCLSIFAIHSRNNNPVFILYLFGVPEFIASQSIQGWLASPPPPPNISQNINIFSTLQE